MLLKQNTPITSILVAALLLAGNFVQAQNVGIGVEQPTSRLHLNGDIAFTSDAMAIISVNKSPEGIYGNSLTIKAGSVVPYHNAIRGGSIILQAGNGVNITGLEYGGGDVILRSGGNLTRVSQYAPVFNSGNIIFQRGDSINGAEDKWIEMMRLDYRGNVGIGKIADPQTKLDVNGKLRVTGFQMATGAAAGAVLTSAADGNANWATFSSLETDPQVGDNTTNFLSKWNGTQLVSSTVFENTGNVGIGIAPARRLDVSGTGGLRVSSTNPGTGTTDWIAGNFGATAGDRVVMGNLNSAATLGAHNNALNAWANLAINPAGGNVGVGLANPLNKLDVEGGVAIGSNYAGSNGAPANGAIIEGRLGVGLPNPATQLDVFGNFKLGKSGSELTNIIKATVAFLAKPFPANASTGTTYAVAGAGVGGSVMVSPSAPLPSGLVIAFASVSSNGNVDVVFCNTLGAPISYAGGINLFITVVN